MKNIIFKLSVVLLVVGTLVGCEEDPLIYDINNGQTLAQFNSSSLSIGVPEEGASSTVDVLVTTVAPNDREIQVEIVDSLSTATSDQFTISNLVIPAGSFTGEITITGNFDALPETGNVDLVLNLVDIASSNALVENGSLAVEMFRKCPVVLDNLVGTYSSVDQYGFGDTVEIALNDDGELVINGLGFNFMTSYWGEVIIANEPVVMNVNPEDETITIEEQFYLSTTWNGGREPDYLISASGVVLNACQNKMRIDYTYFQPGYGAFPYVFKASLVKQ